MFLLTVYSAWYTLYEKPFPVSIYPVMNKLKVSIRISVLVFLVAILSGCAVPDRAAGGDLDNQIRVGVVSTITREAFLQEVEDSRGTESAKQATDQYLASTDTPQPSWTSSPTTTPTEVFPDMVPGAPYFVQIYIWDTLSVELADTKSTIGDDYAWSRFERPFSKGLMLYSGYLDIYQVNLEVRDEWVYITFILAERLPVEGSAQYAIELDVDHNGRGDYLITAGIPPDNNWTTDGVSVYADENKDVGGFFPLYMEEIESSQDGYESVLAADGEGSDPDLAWVRRDPKHQTRLQLAFKYSLTGPYGFLWSAWASGGELDPALFDINDHITFEDAGSPNKQNSHYPLNQVALIDSTCRSWYGYLPSGDEPGLCYTGALALERPGYGWCKANAYSNSCENKACLVNCPPDSFCIPCKLSQ